MVSIIVPVYNVENYIDKCISSIVNQTYSDIEIIIMEGKSQDDSLKKCLKWAQKDSRIKVYSKEDKGLGDARNKGLSIASGQYFMFVDSDDWLDKNCVNKLLKLALMEDADVVCCNYYSYNYLTGEKKEKNINYPEGSFSNLKQIQLYIGLGFPTAWGKLYKKELWIKNNIKTPLTRHEDCGVFPIYMLLSNKIIYCDEPLYYYLEFRNNSLVNIPENRKEMPLALKYAMDDLKKRNMFQVNYNILKIYAKKFIIGSMFEARKVLNEEQYKKIIEKSHLEFLDKYFPDWNNYSNTYLVTAMGGFGLRWIIHEGIEGVNGLKPHLCFSSLVSQMQLGKINEEIIHKVELRQKAISYDFQGKLKDVLFKKHSNNELFFIDFMEEHYDLLILEDGNICTNSDALKETDYDKLNIKRVIKYGSQEFWVKWENACLELTRLIKKSYNNNNIFLLKNRYASTYQNGEKHINYDINMVKNKNDDIRKMERFFIMNMKDVDIHIIELPKNLLYTEENFKYGIESQYSNNRLYMYLGLKLKLELMERND